MNKKEFKAKLQKLAKKLGTKRLTQKDIKEAGLHYPLYDLYDGVADAIEDAGLEPTHLAKRMRISNEELLKRIYDLGKKLGKRPTYMDLKKAGEGGKIYKTRFGSPKKAYELALTTFGSQSIKRKIEKLPKIHKNKGNFYGSAGEYYVVSELLYRGFIAQIMPVDLGLDVYATKGEKIFFFQVKNVSFDKGNKRTVPITISSFERNKSNNVFYVFVVQKQAKKDALVLPYILMNDLQEDKYLKIEKNKKKMYISLKKERKSIFIYKKDNPKIKKNMTKYLNKWNVVV